ncbi:MAG: CPBP family intramembrane metalloprotease [Alphaproteobacteria bacterium]|nr:CPBP family intramembrane metalloprotease [Alphaproteobacteria bacterium]
MSMAPALPPGPVPWGVVATVAWLMLSFAAGALGASLLFSAWQGTSSPRGTPGFDGVALTIGAMAAFPVQVAVLAYAARVRGWRIADYLALNMPRRGEVVMSSIVVVGLILAFNALWLLIGQDIVSPFQVQTYRSAKETGWLPLLLIAIVVIAPIAEEITFRGFAHRGLALPGWEIYAIVVIALAWALMHIQYDWLGMAQIFTIGLVLGWFRWASGSTTLAILMHGLVNLEAMIETAIKVEFLS